MSKAENPYGLIVDAEPNQVLWYTCIALMLVAICIISATVRYWSRAGKSVPERHNYFVAMALLGLMSLTIGWLGFLAEVRRTLIKVGAIGDVNWETMAGPISESLLAVLWGTTGFLLAIILSFVAAIRSRYPA